VFEFGSLLGVGLEVLLDQSGSGGTDSSILADLSSLEEDGFTLSTFNVISEESSGFSDDGGSFFVFSNLLFEFFSFFSSFGI